MGTGLGMLGIWESEAPLTHPWYEDIPGSARDRGVMLRHAHRKQQRRSVLLLWSCLHAIEFIPESNRILCN